MLVCHHSCLHQWWFFWLRYLLYRWVLSELLNCSMLLDNFISSGIQFHSVGPVTAKDLAANVLYFVKGIMSQSIFFLDLRPCLLTGFKVIKFLRYFGAFPHKHLYTSTKILKSIRALIGSQCNSLRHSVILS